MLAKFCCLTCCISFGTSPSYGCIYSPVIQFHYLSSYASGTVILTPFTLSVFVIMLQATTSASAHTLYMYLRWTCCYDPDNQYFTLLTLSNQHAHSASTVEATSASACTLHLYLCQRPAVMIQTTSTSLYSHSLTNTLILLIRLRLPVPLLVLFICISARDLLLRSRLLLHPFALSIKIWYWQVFLLKDWCVPPACGMAALSLLFESLAVLDGTIVIGHAAGWIAFLALVGRSCFGVYCALYTWRTSDLSCKYNKGIGQIFRQITWAAANETMVELRLYPPAAMGSNGKIVPPSC